MVGIALASANLLGEKNCLEKPLKEHSDMVLHLVDMFARSNDEPQHMQESMDNGGWLEIQKITSKFVVFVAAPLHF